ncbi:NF038122 family metalloprotease, partial [Calothrix rhizosoleniae]|uniref:NF038122 family metalloprotease n=1 Tax=Calothrix rhizosoleniae TaxID=888997 RepID=UPI00190EF842
LDGSLVLDASVITYKNGNPAENYGQQLYNELQAARDLAAQLVVELDSHETQYISQQLQQGQEQLTQVFTQDKGTWTRDLVDPNANDGYIVLNDSFTWDNDYTRTGEAAEQTIDLLSVVLHETGHIMGFTSGIDYSLENNTQYSGQQELSNFTPLDLYRFSADSNTADLSGNLFTIDGGNTVLATLSTGLDNDDYQASHWQNRYDSSGIMDPTLSYKERAEISKLDVQTMDVLGYDTNPDAVWAEDGSWTVDLGSYLEDAKQQVADKLGVTVAWIEQNVSADYFDAILASGGDLNSESTDTTTDSTLADIDAFKQWWLDNHNTNNGNGHGHGNGHGYGNSNSGLGNENNLINMWQSAYNAWFYSSGDEGTVDIWYQELYKWWFADTK